MFNLWKIRLQLVIPLIGCLLLTEMSQAQQDEERSLIIDMNHLDTSGTASICGVKFWDLDCDSVRDVGEPLLPNYPITITGPVNTLVLTDGSGAYCFTMLPPGTYNVKEFPVPGFTQTYPETLDYDVTIVAKEMVTGIDFGNCGAFPPVDPIISRICTGKWNDANENGLWDEDESGIPGWPIIVDDGANPILGYTDSIGQYCFDSLSPGTYTVFEGAQPGWSQTWPGGVGSYEVEIFGGETIDSLFFGNSVTDPVTICGVKWHDYNRNGKKDKDEPGLAGFTIILAGPMRDTIITDSDGTYCFTGLIYGQYTLRELGRPGFLQTHPSTPGTYSLDLVPGEVDTGRNFGNVDTTLSELCCDQWKARFNHNEYTAIGEHLLNKQWARALVVDSKGNAYVTGYGEHYKLRREFTHFLTIKYDPYGNRLWADALIVGNHYKDQPAAIVLAPDEQSVYITGVGVDEHFASDQHKDYLTVQYSSTGTLLNQVRYDAGNKYDDYATGIAVDAVGNVYVTGASEAKNGPTRDYDYATIRYDQSLNPSSAVVIRYNATKFDDIARSIAVDERGGHTYVYVTGSSRRTLGLNFDYATIKYEYLHGSTAFSQKWLARYEGEHRDDANALVVDRIGDVIVTGASRTGISDKSLDYLTIKYDGPSSTGTEKWQRRYDPDQRRDEAVAIAVDVNRNVFVTGNCQIGSFATNDKDYGTVSYDLDGNQRWDVRYDGDSRRDAATSIDVDNAGDVYVTGYSKARSTKFDYVTIKYQNSNGAHLWMNSMGAYGGIRYNGTASKDDDAVAVKTKVYVIGDSLHACVWVTGTSIGMDTRQDFLTARYPQYPEGPIGEGRTLFAGDEGDGETSTIPLAPLTLRENYPNPFNPTTMIQFTLGSESHVTLAIHNILGQKIETLLDRELLDDGEWEEEFDATGFPSGIYFYRITVEQTEQPEDGSEPKTITEVKKMMVVK